MLANRKSIDVTHEHVLAPSDTAKCPQPVAGFEKDPRVGSKVGVDHGARGAGVDQQIRNTDGGAPMREGRRDEREVMAECELHRFPGSRSSDALRSRAH